MALCLAGEGWSNMRKFNVNGLCVPHKHYMVDISEKVRQILKLVNDEHYFTINRARQYGKTTTLNQLENALLNSGDHFCASISFEEQGLNDFDTEAAFCDMFLSKISHALLMTNAGEEYSESWYASEVTEIRGLGRHITKMCKGKKLILMIDEVDKTSENRLFLHFLGMLRAKYLSRQAEADYTFHSVILAGVTDIKNLKLKMINDGLHEPLAEEGRIFNSPWNIAAAFDVDMSFSPDEISTMLVSYEKDHNTGMDISLISNEIYRHTEGYPFLVSRICKHIYDQTDGNWTTSGVEEAVAFILGEENTLFDDMSKNMENHKNLYDFMYELIILGEHKDFNLMVPVVKLASMFGYIKKANGKGKAVVSNRIFENALARYFVTNNANINQDSRRKPGVIYQDIIKGGIFDMEMCILKFAEHYREIYAEEDEQFLERHGRLIFLTYLKPLLNGQGFYHLESQFTDRRRMDIVVDFEKQQFIVELKIWRGPACQEDAYNQLLGYMESKNANEGYLLTFDFRKNANKEYKAEWVDCEGKRIFEVVV